MSRDAAPAAVSYGTATLKPHEVERPRPFLVSSTRSPLASPQTPVHRLAAAVQQLLYFPDPGPLYAVCGTVCANVMRGYPTWLMLIGPPESGKTELLKQLVGLQGIQECGDLSGKGALISGTALKEHAADSTGGVLMGMPLSEREHGVRRGLLVMLDFARTVLAGDPGAARSTMGAIGMLHDQHWQREIGSDGGRTIEFKGRVGFIAACTDMIDHPDHQQTNAEMGERCLYSRDPASDGYHEINATLDSPDGTDKSKQLHELFGKFWAELEWPDAWDDAEEPRRLTDEERKTVAALAQFAARARSGVQRDKYKREEVQGVSRAALGPRLANSLAQLLRGMERAGCTEAERYRVIAQCALDSIPGIRAAVIDLIRKLPSTTTEVARSIRVSPSAAKRTLEDLRLHGLAECTQGDGNGSWRLSDVARSLMKAGWGDLDE